MTHEDLHVPGRNRLLAGLSEAVADRVTGVLEPVSLALKDLLYEPGRPIEYVYFPLTGMVSMVISMEDGGTVEVGTVGNEGLVGTPVFLGVDASPTRVLAQVPGRSLRMAVSDFRKEIAEVDAVLYWRIARYQQALLNQVAQSVACNHLHSIDMRTARWLLMTHDRVGEDEFPLTQEFLSQMLGVRRPSVTVAAGLLEKAGLISYRRGRIKVVDRARLEAASCECYRVVRAEHERLVGGE